MYVKILIFIFLVSFIIYEKISGIMLLVSQNAGNYDIILPNDAVFRINLAWCNTINELEEKLSSNKKSDFFIDLPVGRIKPPNNRYTLDDMIPIIEKHPNVKFFAVSNVESKNDLIEFLEKLPDSVNIVPKIESPNAVQNIDEICNALKTEKKMIMLDHDDLFSSIIRNKENKNSFQNYIKKLVDYCQENNIELLRTVGVVFSDDEKRITQYEK
jgi:citrate lyase beta subunit